MRVSAFFISCMIAGCLACSDEHCKDPALGKELEEIKFLPNKEQLVTLCPKLMTFLECEREFLECPGGNLDEMALSSDRRDASRAKALLGGISFVRDLCDVDSSFHQDYIQSIECFRGYIEVAGQMCREDVAKPVEKFFDELYSSVDVDEREVHISRLCLTDAYLLVCVIDNLGETCGAAAERAAKTAFERLKDTVNNPCAYLENATDLKSRFLDFLELDNERRSKVQGIFDLLKRRR